jgi:hypothetical protein
MTTPEERIRAATAGEPVGGPRVAPLPKRKREYISINEALALTGVARRTLMGWLEQGKVQRFKARGGFRVLIDKAELLSFDAARRTSKAGCAPVVIDEEPDES